mgnify:CR=1 FL=1|jgi:hypothetical protein
MKIIIDRFEGEYAICETEDGEMINIKIVDLPNEAKEGDVLIFNGDIFIIDNEAKEKRKERIKKLMDDLWE